MNMFKRLSKNQFYVYIFLATFAFGILAHGYCYFNLTYSHDSMLVYQNDIETRIAVGRYIYPIYWLFRGNLYAPTLVGALSLFYLSLSNILILRLLDMQERIFAVLTCGVLTTNVTVTLLNATYIHDVDAYMLSLLLAVSGVYVCRKYKYGLFGSMVLIALSCGLYQSFFQVAIFLFMILVIKDILDGKSFKQVIVYGVKAIAALIMGLAIYYIGMKLTIAYSGVIPMDSYNSLEGIGSYGDLSHISLLLFATRLYVTLYFKNPIIFHSQLVSIIDALLVALMLILLVRLVIAKRVKIVNIILLIVVVLLFPYGINAVYFITKGMIHHLMIYSFFLFYVFILWLLKYYLETVKPRRIVKLFECGRMFLIPGLVTIIVFNSVVYANQTYLKKELEQQNTLSTMTRVIDRIEQTEGYVPGETPVALVGILQHSVVSKDREEFDYSGTGLGCNFSVTYYDTYQWYFEHYLSYPINLVSQEDVEAISDMTEVIDMPSFPSAGCCQMINGIMVVKLSEIEEE